MGGIPAASVAEAARDAEAAFVMVMNGDQAKGVILPPDGLAAHMPAGGVVLLTATIRPREARQIGATLAGSGIDLIDTPVSGGFPGAQGGTLTMMASAPQCWLAIKVSEPGEGVLFVQTRYGRGGRPFKMIKLRTMVKDAESRKMELVHLSEDKGPGFKIKNDPRITKLGRFLRKTHLDELPQFFNVIRGEMSIVGPRANSYHPDHYEPWQLRRLSVKPGITGSWQIAKEKSQDFSERCRMDIEYLEQRSFLVDLRIILATAVAVLRAPGD